MKHPLLAYVLHHFKMIYDLPANVEIGYGKPAKIEIIPGEISFFEKENPSPKQYQVIPWKDTEIPLFFNEYPVNEIFTNQTGHICIHADIIASAFYLLSGWQEYYTSERDGFGRFSYKSSIQYKYQFAEIPVVNYYFDILKTAVEKAYLITLKRKLWPDFQFATCITHDVDRLHSAWKVLGIEALKKGNFKTVFNLFLRKWIKKDLWDNLTEVQQFIESFQARATFFFLPSQDKYQNHTAADYNIQTTNIRKQIDKIVQAGHDIGVHGSFGTATNSARFLDEIQKIGQKITGNRFHYLIYDPQKTPDVIEKSGLKYDSTLGFAEQFGFRNSYCFPFQPYNFEKKTNYDFIEIPLILMDTTLQPHYLNIPSTAVLKNIKPLISEIKKFNGCFTILWHNENVFNQTDKNEPVLSQILTFCQTEQTTFLTGYEIAKNEGYMKQNTYEPL